MENLFSRRHALAKTAATVVGGVIPLASAIAHPSPSGGTRSDGIARIAIAASAWRNSMIEWHDALDRWHKYVPFNYATYMQYAIRDRLDEVEITPMQERGIRDYFETATAAAAARQRLNDALGLFGPYQID